MPDRQPANASASNSSTTFEYVPYHLLDGRPNVIVDGSATDGTILTLSHWPNSPCPPGLEEDLSAEMAFAYLGHLGLHGEARAVSNNHFDQDGLVSVFALVQPQAALSRRRMLVDLARAGDFATYSVRDAARASMIISAFSDPGRSPLGSGGGDYLEWTSQLYGELLPRLTDVCERVDDYRNLWVDEDATLGASEDAIASGRVKIDEDPQLDLAVVSVPDDAPSAGGHLFAGEWRMGLHPMAVNNATGMFTLVVVTGARFELFYRYESWVQYRTARPRPRVDLAPLAAELNSIETSGGNWVASKVSALTPKLHLEGPDKGSQEESSIDPRRFIEMAKAHLASAPAAWDPYAVERTGSPTNG